MYKESSECYNGENYSGLILIALDLGIDIGEIDAEQKIIIEERNRFLESEIREYKSSLFWEWAGLTEDQRKEAVIAFGLSKGWAL